MKIKSILLIIIASIAVLDLNGQVDFSFSFGKGEYKMETLKYVNSFVLENLPVEAKVVDNFPMTFFYEGNITYNFKVIHVGASYSYHTSGSRISYFDYSGEIKMDQTIFAHTFGPIVKFNLNPNNRLNFIPFLSTNYAFTSYSSDEHIRVYDQQNSENISFKSQSIILNPGIEIVYSLNKIGISAFGSYSLDTHGDFEYNGNKVTYNGRRFYSDWSGIRYGIRLSYELTKN